MLPQEGEHSGTVLEAVAAAILLKVVSRVRHLVPVGGVHGASRVAGRVNVVTDFKQRIGNVEICDRLACDGFGE